MDVHPPHHPILTWRDFFIHIATITIGLLIAIALEQAVEHIHNHLIVREARENIRREIDQNERSAVKDLRHVQENADNMKLNITKARALRANPAALAHGEMHFTFTWDGFNQSAWLSARDSGALTHMDATEVQRYAEVYYQQQIVQTQAVDIFTHQTELAAPLIMEEKSAVIPRDEAQTLLQGSAVAVMRLEALGEFVQELDGMYKDTMKH